MAGIGMRLSGRWWLVGAVAAVGVLGMLMLRSVGGGGDGESPSVVMPTISGTPSSSLPTVAYRELPDEAQDTLSLIDSGGPYPEREDGSAFRNFEGHLPSQGRDYYREFTVDTPAEPGRGPRRIVVGRAGDIYYTEDHYQSFRQVVR